MQVSITSVDWADPDGVMLRARSDAEAAATTDPPPTRAGVFLLARDRATGAAVACGALRPEGPACAQVRSLYVLPEHRGLDLERLVLTELELQARALGWLTLRVEADAGQDDGLTPYTAVGYRRLPPRPGHPGVEVRLEKALTTTPGGPATHRGH